MNDYTELRINIHPCDETATDVMAAVLADIGYESFVPDESGLTAYIPVNAFSEELLGATLSEFPLDGYDTDYTLKTIEGEDWNSEWEKHYFQPIVVGDRCVIHSSFHKDIPQCQYDIVIDPKMAFGTGHHATTSLIIEQLLETDLKGLHIIDMGTGTGILAILAAMRGARKVTGIEIDPAAEKNAQENIVTNGHPEITILLGDASLLAGLPPADIFIANINRNIITADLSRYADALKPGGTMLLSGFYESDIPVIMSFATPLGLKETGHTVKGDNWTCLRLNKQS
ncbi:MAG: 50S ribosomal protein L11 methyltransferase [Muribaculaceae bacterium]|nr:50S ribosomal protein L11 methyltransferase [Muribaculaceae bacterium]